LSQAVLRQEIGKELFYLKNVRGKITQRSGFPANINVQRFWVLMEIIEPSLDEKVRVGKKISERNRRGLSIHDWGRV